MTVRRMRDDSIPVRCKYAENMSRFQVIVLFHFHINHKNPMRAKKGRSPISIIETIHYPSLWKNDFELIVWGWRGEGTGEQAGRVIPSQHRVWLLNMGYCNLMNVLPRDRPHNTLSWYQWEKPRPVGPDLGQEYWAALRPSTGAVNVLSWIYSIGL
jgi:hypothetical protein